LTNIEKKKKDRGNKKEEEAKKRGKKSGNLQLTQEIATNSAKFQYSFR
jgi:hypothetical protein